MPKLFICSDIHSAYTLWMEALNEAGFDENNPEHKIIVCGDLFDRMDESLEVYNFAKDMLEKGKMIYVLGNHDLLMKDCVRAGWPSRYDWHNGTAKSIIDLAPEVNNFYDACDVVRKKMKPIWDKTVNYVETSKYIFVHSWIPVINKDGLPAHYTRNRSFEWNPDWRNASRKDWEAATWGDPFDMAQRGLNQTGKVIIFGHWHCSKGWAQSEGRSEFGEDAKFEPYYGDGFISVDSCVAHSGKCNCLVLEDDFLED